MKFENFDNDVEVFKNACCSCCGIPRVSSKHYIKPDGTVVRSTVDHDLLASLGGSYGRENLNDMCFECNQLRGNLFAEFSEFIDWYWSGNDLPTEKNYSYIHKDNNTISEHERYLLQAAYNKIYNQTHKKSMYKNEVQHSTTSKVLDTITLNGVRYIQYKHPTYGTSIIKEKQEDNNG